MNKIIQYYKINKGQDKNFNQIKMDFEYFKLQNFDGKNYYADPSAVFKHYMNVVKQDKINGFTHKEPVSQSIPKVTQQDLDKYRKKS